jgi:hypothetical protein
MNLGKYIMPHEAMPMAYKVGPANQGGCIIRCVGNIEDEKL